MFLLYQEFILMYFVLFFLVLKLSASQKYFQQSLPADIFTKRGGKG
jgi:hypothetical protein